MKLNITLNYEKSFTEDQFNLATNMLTMKSTHFFIASNVWDSIYLELDDLIPEGYLANLHLVSNDIKVKLPAKITDKTLRLLTELYPDKSGTIRKNYMMGRDMSEVLGDCLV